MGKKVGSSGGRKRPRRAKKLGGDRVRRVDFLAEGKKKKFHANDERPGAGTWRGVRRKETHSQNGQGPGSVLRKRREKRKRVLHEGGEKSRAISRRRTH